MTDPVATACLSPKSMGLRHASIGLSPVGFGGPVIAFETWVLETWESPVLRSECWTSMAMDALAAASPVIPLSVPLSPTKTMERSLAITM
jgi:hypothetical protein